MKKIIEWFVRNPVAANLIMIVIVAMGLLTAYRVKLETFPEINMDMISITVPYRGAAPEEVEEGVCVRIEEAIQGLEGIKKISSTASENIGSVMVEIEEGSDPSKLLDEIKSRVDGIATFPVESEKAVITELTTRRSVINVAVFGDADEMGLKAVAERVRDDLIALDGITVVEIAGARPYEVSIEVSETALRQYGLTLSAVANAIRASSLDMPGGAVKTAGGEILLRTKGQAYHGEEFEKLVLLSRPDGSRITLGDVADVIDGFEDTDQLSRFDDKRTMMLRVFRVGDQSALDVAGKVKAYVEATRSSLPEGITVAPWQDMSKVLKDRLMLLTKNGIAGFILVVILLALFLRFRLAMWVSLGIPVSFLGGLWLMPSMDISVNLISLFAFIVVLGIVVDDAIVIGENVHTHQQSGEDAITASIRGANEVSTPVVFAVLTTIAAFAPLLFVEGRTGKIMANIPMIVIPTLIFSLIESLWVLPAHLRHLKRQKPGDGNFFTRRWRRFQGGVSSSLDWWIERVYRPSLDLAIEWRYLTLAIGIASVLLTAGVAGGGLIKFTFFPDVEADFVTATLTMPQGTPAEVTALAVAQLEEAANRTRDEFDAQDAAPGQSIVRHMLASVGEQPVTEVRNSHGGGAVGQGSGAHLGEVALELAYAEDRRVASTEVVSRWRELTGTIPDAVELSFTSSLFSPGEAINVQLSSPDVEALRDAADELKVAIAGYPGAYDVADSYRAGKQEIKLNIGEEAETLGLTLSNLARQVRQAFYGEEAQRIQRGRDDVRIMVRFPEQARRSLGDLETMRIRTPQGNEVPFSQVATANFGRGYASIRRVNRNRVINVTAGVDDTKGNANEIIAELESNVLPRIISRHPELRYSLEGQSREQADTMKSLLFGLVFALIAIYALMAIPFKSYIQPLIVMTAIPFGLVGAIWGHVLMGMNLTILSMFGAVALTGVVINDSLVMVDYVNQRRREGMSLGEAIRVAGCARFRPILLTSITTFAGLTPLLLEKSMQAQFLIPMAISLGFGVLFATFVTLMIVPSCYLILEDIYAIYRKNPKSAGVAG